MENFGNLMDGFGIVLSGYHLALMAAGVLLGILVGVLPGQDRSLPPILLMAHYDSVPASPGAADDAAGVAAILESVRAIRARRAAAPRRRAATSRADRRAAPPSPGATASLP